MALEAAAIIALEATGVAPPLRSSLRGCWCGDVGGLRAAWPQSAAVASRALPPVVRAPDSTCWAPPWRHQKVGWLLTRNRATVMRGQALLCSMKMLRRKHRSRSESFASSRPGPPTIAVPRRGSRL